MKDNNTSKENIRSFGFFATIFLSLVGFGVFTYSQSIGKVLGTTGVLMTIIYGFLYLFFVYIINKVIKLNNYLEFDHIVEGLFGKFLGKILLFIISLGIVFLISVQLRIFIDSIKMYIFQNIGNEFMIIMTLLVCYYVVKQEDRVLVGLNEITFVFLILSSLIILSSIYKNLNFANALPFKLGSTSSFSMGFLTFTSFLPGIISLFYFFPKYRSNEKKKIHVTYKAVFFSSIFLVIVFLICIGSLNIKQTIQSIWPVILAFTTFDIKESFIGRIDGIIITIAVIFFIINFINLYFYASFLNSKALNLTSHKYSSTIFLPVIYIITLLPRDLSDTEFITSNIIFPICVGITIILPILLLIATYIKGIFNKGAYKHEKNNS